MGFVKTKIYYILYMEEDQIERDTALRDKCSIFLKDHRTQLKNNILMILKNI